MTPDVRFPAPCSCLCVRVRPEGEITGTGGGETTLKRELAPSVGPPSPNSPPIRAPTPPDLRESTLHRRRRPPIEELVSYAVARRVKWEGGI